MQMGKRRVGLGEPVYLIFEVASTHEGSFDVATACVEEAARAGADAVKFQLFEAKELIAPLTPAFQATYEYFKRSETPREWFPKLKAFCDEKKIDLLCTPFSSSGASFLSGIGVPAIKVASGDLTNVQLLRHIATLGKPIILSTGMATMEEVRRAVEIARGQGAEVALLQSVSVYPTSYEDANVAAMHTLAEEFGVVVGYSDNGSKGTLVPLLAVANGASIIEKHVTLDKGRGNIDDIFSMSVEEFKDMAQRIREFEGKEKEAVMEVLRKEFGTDVDVALGNGIKKPGTHGTKKTHPGIEGAFIQKEADERHWARRGVYVNRSVKKGETIQEEMLSLLRPDVGISAVEYEKVIGQSATEDLETARPLAFVQGGVALFRRVDIARTYKNPDDAAFAQTLKETALFE